MKIIIDKYSPEWKIKFEAEKCFLEKALDLQGVIIEHIGSTAVEGLDAKPVIDIMIGLPYFSSEIFHIEKKYGTVLEI
ncbi:MAG: GrpB family protein [Bacteroidia bacterium]|nr:GrpB family protein [Bacteroidia bacterium]